ncbi:MAG: hypothetical protein WCC48_01010, partial [Anaeromyxobacteraceae bacterium]
RMVDAVEPAMPGALAADLALATRAFAAGQLDLLRYQQARRDAIDARLERIAALEALNRAAAQLERALGRP